MNTYRRGLRYPFVLCALFLAVSLLIGCGQSAAVPPTPEPYPPYATGGDVFATYGDAFATEGNAIPLEQQVDFATDGNAQPTRTVTVSTVAELLEAIAPDTCVVLKSGDYLLDPESANKLYDYCYWSPLGYEEGHELVLNVWNCVITGESDDPADVRLITEPRMATVLTLEFCSQVQLKNLTLGHTEGAVCSGGVLKCRGCGGVYVENCDLYGCGTVGVSCESSSAVTVADSVIHDCSYQGVYALSSQSVLFDHCTFKNCAKYVAVSLRFSSWCLFDHCEFTDNHCTLLLDCAESGKIFFDFCSFREGDFDSLYFVINPIPPEFKRCTFENVRVASGSDFLSEPVPPGDPDSPRQAVVIDGKTITP